MLFKESGDSVNEGRSEAEKYSCCLWDPAGLLMEPAITVLLKSHLGFSLLYFFLLSCFFYAKQLS